MTLKSVFNRLLLLLLLLGLISSVLLAIVQTAQAQDNGEDEDLPPRIGDQEEQPQPQGTPETQPDAEVDPTRLDADVWVETWFRRSVDIHKVMPDGEREGTQRAVRMYYNFSIDAYVKDSSKPFTYKVWVNGQRVNEGQATWKLHWVTSVAMDSFNITVELSQDGKTRRADWALIIGVPGEDAGIGGGGGGEAPPGPDLIEVERNAFSKLTWTIVGASVGQIVVAFVIVGNIYLERKDALAWIPMVG